MKNKRGFVIECLSQVAVLTVCSAALFLCFRQRAVFKDYSFARYFDYFYLAAFILLLLLAASIALSFFANYFLKRYDPGDPESVRSLGKIRRYHLNEMEKRALRQSGDAVEMGTRWLKRRGFSEVSRRTFGIIYERGARTPIQALLGRSERYFLVYRPMLNVIIEDRLLSEAANFIYERSEAFCRRNLILIMTDMENDSEVLSSAAGVVNYLCRLDNGVLLPLLLDLRRGRLFFPQDLSLLNWRDRLFFFIERRALSNALRQSGSGIPAKAARPVMREEKRNGEFRLPTDSRPPVDSRPSIGSRPTSVKTAAAVRPEPISQATRLAPRPQEQKNRATDSRSSGEGSRHS